CGGDRGSGSGGGKRPARVAAGSGGTNHAAPREGRGRPTHRLHPGRSFDRRSHSRVDAGGKRGPRLREGSSLAPATPHSVGGRPEPYHRTAGGRRDCGGRTGSKGRLSERWKPAEAGRGAGALAEP